MPLRGYFEGFLRHPKKVLLRAQGLGFRVVGFPHYEKSAEHQTVT